jgi:hypothetical protein
METTNTRLSSTNFRLHIGRANLVFYLMKACSQNDRSGVKWLRGRKADDGSRLKTDRCALRDYMRLAGPNAAGRNDRHRELPTPRMQSAPSLASTISRWNVVNKRQPFAGICSSEFGCLIEALPHQSAKRRFLGFRRPCRLR